MSDDHRLLIVDLSVNPAIYRPVDHWRPHVEALGVPVDVCRPPDGDAPADLAPYSHAILTVGEYEGIRNVTPRAFLDLLGP
jgi:hypothetical protein